MMEQKSRTGKTQWLLILLGIAVVCAIGSQIECTIAVPKCCDLSWKSTSRWNRKIRDCFFRCQ